MYQMVKAFTQPSKTSATKVMRRLMTSRYRITKRVHFVHLVTVSVQKEKHVGSSGFRPDPGELK
jgi:hypothetical protein